MERESRIRGFDGVRAVAILSVILWHTYIVLKFPRDLLGPIDFLVSSSWAGVDVFFALSGFLITTILLRDEDRGRHDQPFNKARRFNLKSFYVRRSLRILPLFYVVFLANTFLLPLSSVFQSTRAGVILEKESFLSLLPFALFLGNYHGIYGPSLPWFAIYPGHAYSVTWSLCVEEHFYLLWPLFLYFTTEEKHRLRCAFVACGLVMIARFVSMTLGLEPHRALHVLSHYRIDSLLWGCIGALVARKKTLSPRNRRLLLLLFGGLGTALLASRQLSVIPTGTALGNSLGLTAIALATTLLLLEIHAEPHGLLTRTLELGPFRTIGRLSYATYLIHFQALDVTRVLLARTPLAAEWPILLLIAGLAASVSLGIAYPLHVLVERPFLALKERVAPLGSRDVSSDEALTATRARLNG
jgi:peptidoglycan/LPS O-acetylase OafA/YrhL